MRIFQRNRIAIHPSLWNLKVIQLSHLGVPITSLSLLKSLLLYTTNDNPFTAHYQIQEHSTMKNRVKIIKYAFFLLFLMLIPAGQIVSTVSASEISGVFCLSR